MFVNAYFSQNCYIKEKKETKRRKTRNQRTRRRDSFKRAWKYVIVCVYTFGFKSKILRFIKILFLKLTAVSTMDSSTFKKPNQSDIDSDLRLTPQEIKTKVTTVPQDFSILEHKEQKNCFISNRLTNSKKFLVESIESYAILCLTS